MRVPQEDLNEKKAPHPEDYARYEGQHVFEDQVRAEGLVKNRGAASCEATLPGMPIHAFHACFCLCPGPRMRRGDAGCALT